FGRGPTGGRFEGGSGPAVDAVSTAGGLAGRFEGDVAVTGDVQLLGADLAEDFRVTDRTAEPGTVMVLAGEDAIEMSSREYDRRAIGVVSGGGSYRPALRLDHLAETGRQPLALVGKVFCKVDANYAPVAVGDLLTTSATPGHAMKASDAERAFGAVIGKAM